MMSSDSQAMGRVGEVIIPHLADGAQDEVAAADHCGGSVTQRQRARQALHRQVHDQPGAGNASRTRSARSKSANGKTWCCGSRRLRRQAELVSRAASSRPRRWADPNASIPTPQPGAHAADVRAFGGAVGRNLTQLRQQTSLQHGVAEVWPAKQLAAVKGWPHGDQAQMVHNAYAPKMEIYCADLQRARRRAVA